MYCPQCGADNVPNLKFCKRCGTNLDVVSYSLGATPEQLFAQPLIGPEHVKTILWVIGLIVVGGLGMLAGLLVSLAKLLPPNRADDAVGMLGFFGFASLTLIVLFLLRLLSRKGAVRKERVTSPAADRAGVTNAAYLPPAAIASVVEPTTSRLQVEERVTKG